ncbi:MAG: hypothetical protein R3A44_07365 [Caldilineaceae bacterium]
MVYRCLLCGAWVERLPRLIGEQSHHINYRHVIESLLRKPGGFRRYRFREDLFPRLIFRRAWEQLNQWHTPRKADIIYLQISIWRRVHWKKEVAAALETLVAQGTPWGQADVERLRRRNRWWCLTWKPNAVDLHHYDQLLEEVLYEPA